MMNMVVQLRRDHCISAMGLACMVTRLMQISVVGRKVFSSTGTFSKSSRVS